jgi:diamine N-acetyltransferase
MQKETSESVLKMETEYEKKYDIPENLDIASFISDFTDLLEKQKSLFLKTSDKTRHFEYFDDPSSNYPILSNGQTLRCVSGFDPANKDGKANYRYDYKLGEIGTPERKEGNHWTNEQLSTQELLSRLDLSNLMNSCTIVSEASTRHIKNTFQFGDAKIESSIDIFKISEKDGFREIELEFVSGELQDFQKFLQLFTERFASLIEVKEQKYDRVMNAEIQRNLRESKMAVESLYGEKNLAHFAKKYISADARNENFQKDPDSPLEHTPKWHEFGIITHSEEVLSQFVIHLNAHLEKWGINQEISAYFDELIEGKSKKQLFELALVFHDIGKFARTFEENGSPEYEGHEAKSEEIIRTDEELQNYFKENLGLSDKQIDYIAKVAGLHFELGKVRKIAKGSPEKYTLNFAKSEKMKETSSQIISENPDFAVEIGIAFLVDTLGKTKAINNPEEITEEILNTSKMKEAIHQIPVNIAVAKEYLKQVLALKTKKEMINEEINVFFSEINDANIDEVLKIEVKEDQKQNVPDIHSSLELARKSAGTSYFAINNTEGKVIGFLSYGVYEGARCPKIFRLMIDKNHQGKGHGKSALNSAIKRIFEEYDTNEIELCYNHLDDVLKALYSKAGFVDVEIQPCDMRPTGKMLARLTRK